MANDNDEYRFKIDAYSPDSIPMSRLAEYMVEFAKLLANTDRVHFKRLEKGSTVLVSRVEHEAIPKVADRLQSMRLAEGPKDATEAVARINDMLRDDNATGMILKDADGQTAQVYRFPGKEIQRPQKMGPFSEPAIFKGELVRLGGEDDTKHALIKDSQGRVWSGDMSREVAIQMRGLLFEWVQVEGMARWVRNEDGAWDLKGFHVQSFKVLPKDSLEADVKNLRNIAGNQWKDLQDPTGFIRESRKDDDEIH